MSGTQESAVRGHATFVLCALRSQRCEGGLQSHAPQHVSTILAIEDPLPCADQMVSEASAGVKDLQAYINAIAFLRDTNLSIDYSQLASHAAKTPLEAWEQLLSLSDSSHKRDECDYLISILESLKAEFVKVLQRSQLNRLIVLATVAHRWHVAALKQAHAQMELGLQQLQRQYGADATLQLQIDASVAEMTVQIKASQATLQLQEQASAATLQLQVQAVEDFMHNLGFADI
jgi:hypothetical protein